MDNKLHPIPTKGLRIVVESCNYSNLPMGSTRPVIPWVHNGTLRGAVNTHSCNITPVRNVLKVKIGCYAVARYDIDLLEKRFL